MPWIEFKKLAADEHPRVRLEAVRAASFFREPDAVEVVAISAERPSDQYLDFVSMETMKTLQDLRHEGRLPPDTQFHSGILPSLAFS